MKKELLEQMVNDGKSLNTISKETGKSLTTIRYWSNKYGIKSKFKTFSEKGKKDYGEFRYCPRCKQDCPINNFYSRRGKKHSSVYCKKCTNEQTIERTQSIKEQMVNYKGGECSRCGYDTYIGALEFHHLDPTQKDFNLSKLKKNKFDEKIKDELDKCILVCANCHREIHHELRTEKN
jgi:hypothetical protein